MTSPFDMVRMALQSSSANLAAARANVEAAESAQALAITILSALEPDESGECKHANRLDMATMGNPDRWRCTDCGHVHDGASVSGITTQE